MPPAWLDRCGEAGRELGRGLLQLLYPAGCHFCGRPLPDAALFCAACRAAFCSDSIPACLRCAAEVGPFAVTGGRCVHCREEAFAFDGALRLGPYDGPLRDAVLRMKSHSGETLAELLGELWAEHADPAFRAVGADALVPVPLHWRRRWLRGYNQSLALARGLAARLRLPCGEYGLRRVRATPLQTSQSFAGRRANVRGAFTARNPRLAGKTLLLVDDVMTTGATASEAARALKAAGAFRVVVAALTRAAGPP